MTDRSRNSDADRKECFKRCKHRDAVWGIVMDCHICGGIITPATQEWEADHDIPRYFGGVKTMPAHERCHRKKTSQKDLPDIAKNKRQEARIYGVKRTAGTMPGSRRSRFKKKMDGTVERRS